MKKIENKCQAINLLIEWLIEVCDYPEDTDFEVYVTEEQGILVRIYFKAGDQLFISEYKLAELMQMAKEKLQKLREAALIPCPYLKNSG